MDSYTCFISELAANKIIIIDKNKLYAILKVIKYTNIMIIEDYIAFPPLCNTNRIHIVHIQYINGKFTCKYIENILANSDAYYIPTDLRDFKILNVCQAKNIVMNKIYVPNKKTIFIYRIYNPLGTSQYKHFYVICNNICTINSGRHLSEYNSNILYGFKSQALFNEFTGHSIIYNICEICGCGLARTHCTGCGRKIAFYNTFGVSYCIPPNAIELAKHVNVYFPEYYKFITKYIQLFLPETVSTSLLNNQSIRMERQNGDNAKYRIKLMQQTNYIQHKKSIEMLSLKINKIMNDQLLLFSKNTNIINTMVPINNSSKQILNITNSGNVFFEN